MTKHPIQPLIKDSHGTTRFKSNAIVRFLLDNGPHDMNSLAMNNFSQEDREQFAQLIGYSLGGFSELSYVSDETYKKAAAQLNVAAAPMTESKAASNGVAVNESQTELRLVDDTQKETSQSYYEKKLARVAKHAEKYITTDRQLAEFRELIAEETRKETE